MTDVPLTENEEIENILDDLAGKDLQSMTGHVMQALGVSWRRLERTHSATFVCRLCETQLTAMGGLVWVGGESIAMGFGLDAAMDLAASLVSHMVACHTDGLTPGALETAQRLNELDIGHVQFVRTDVDITTSPTLAVLLGIIKP